MTTVGERTGRPGYGELPTTVRSWAERVLGEPVSEAASQPGGFSPGVAARLSGRGGRRVFVKAVSAVDYPVSAAMHRNESRISAALPGSAPAPRLLSSYDDDEWVALAFADVDGRQPALPWRADELSRVVSALDAMARDLTPCPIADAVDLTAGWRDTFTYWRDAAAAPPGGLDGWALRHLDRLADLEAHWTDAAVGDTLLHLDVRADNVLLTAERVWFVDWPSAARGAAVFDVVAFAPSVAMQGGPGPDELLAMSAVGRAADQDVVTVLAVTVAGYLAVGSLAPAPPGLPTVRAFQAAQGAVALKWVAQRTGW